ncbi:MAG: DMT family transporter, partial [Oscillospiraceae bacterium]|nr:DMT family transporter [Oscillospiraceae bacterium]
MKNQNYMSHKASAGLLLTALIWGFAFIVVKSSLDKIGAFYMLAFRFSIATLGLSVIFFKRLKFINRSMLKNGFVLGLLLFIGYALQTIGCKYTTAGKNAFLTAVYVVLVPFLHRLINDQKTKRINIIASLIALLGIGLISLRRDFS